MTQRRISSLCLFVVTSQHLSGPPEEVPPIFQSCMWVYLMTLAIQMNRGVFWIFHLQMEGYCFIWRSFGSTAPQWCLQIVPIKTISEFLCHWQCRHIKKTQGFGGPPFPYQMEIGYLLQVFLQVQQSSVSESFCRFGGQFWRCERALTVK
jgi:hypothetical protein